MMRLHRSALFAGLLALGLSACGDDVQIVEAPPAPPPALNATLAPLSHTVTVGGNADYGVGVSGGAAGETATWTCTSANTSVATVVQTATGCRATGVAAGSTSVSVVVTKGDQTANASAGIVVNAVSTTPARLSIGTINSNATGLPVVLAATQGQIDVTLNLTRNTESPSRVELLLGGTVVATQNLVAQAAAEVDGEQVVEQITLSFNTAAYTVNTTTGVATVAHQNGARVLSARTVVGTTNRAADNTVTLTLTNPDVIHIAALTLPTNNTLDALGQRWYGGSSGSVGFTAIPVLYSGRTASQMSVAVFGAGCALPATDTSAPFTFSSPCATAQSAINPVAGGITAQATDGNAIAFGAAVGAGAPVAPVVPGTNPFPVFVDNVAPVGAALRFASQANIGNRENWGNGSYSLVTGYTAPTDAGVGLPAGANQPEADFQVRTGTTVVAGHSFADDVRTLAGLPNSVDNLTYNAQVRVSDRLGNATTVTMAANAGHLVTNAAATSHPLATFGVDKDAPVATRGVVGAGAIAGAQATLDAAVAVYEVQATDVLSGFALPVAAGGPGEALRHAHVSVLGTANSATLTTAGLIGTGGVNVAPFATANSGAFVRTPANYTDGYVQGPTSITTNASVSGSVGVPVGAAYYIYQAQARDKAGNLSNIVSYQVYRNAGSSPAITGLVIGGLMTGGGTATFPAVTQDAVEVSQGSFDLTYGAGVLGNGAGDRIVYERPAPAASTLFDDAIAIPNSFNLVANGFIRGLQGVAGGGPPFAPVAGQTIANTITARAYNGLTPSLTLAQVSHADADAGAANGTTGASAYAAAAILPGQVQPGTDFTSLAAGLAIADFEIVSYGATSSGSTRTITLLVRATGPSGTFQNPFPGGLRLYQRTAAGNVVPADDTAGDAFLRPVTATVTPLFTSPFPTLDNGVQRDYDWSVQFTVPTATARVNLHVLGLSSGFDALGTRETQIDAVNTAAGTPVSFVF